MFLHNPRRRWYAVELGLMTIALAALTCSTQAEPGHPWRPPFGLDRIGQPLAPGVEPTAPFEADAVAQADRVINPVDLGTILVPADWLLLADWQKGTIDIAAICRDADMPDTRAIAWFGSAPAAKTSAQLALVKDRRAQKTIPLPPTPATLDRDLLHIRIC
jgi:hypothetical protein